jgi:hypothetical protein
MRARRPFGENRTFRSLCGRKGILSPVSCLLSPVSCLLSPVSCLCGLPETSPGHAPSPRLADELKLARNYKSIMDLVRSGGNGE